MPKELITLGDHIKKKRLENNLFQKDVGIIIGTDNFTIVNWEKNSTKSIPAKYYPKIMEFLNYCPLEKIPTTITEKIKLHRIHRGLNQKKFTQLLKVDPTAVKFWESEERKSKLFLVSINKRSNSLWHNYPLNN
ncbi:transcriptional regulator [Bathymodiolus septemdierum thioautotrophic gill symbiont]|uniref:HTH cro/C1-type domain-containing protein n=1 Tax=endosymbiont of Bathymodiolus septemdierum str. Myojin knoll TaxID=1303921 RepID=A0A0P0UTF8_9GAMM|nr:transcriptional regulator [Bathymodiolus septemdierum thioautotrophic gill symbiont]BAS68390.1 hypothetical protein BSEPE_1411 [endosymbiont of Bathymodiolus septemdierum str. Myojin knoll]